MNYRALLKGIFIMVPQCRKGLYMLNAEVKECDVDRSTMIIKNANYATEISGELPCKNIKNLMEI